MSRKKFYHGSIADFKEINIYFGRTETDFGQGFYMTNTYSHAEQIARRNAKALNKRHNSENINQAYVYVYEFDPDILKQFNCLEFPEIQKMTTNDWIKWIDFVLMNRESNPNKIKKHNYDVIIGHTADDFTSICLNEYILGTYGTVGSEKAKLRLIDMLEVKNLPSQICISNVELARIIDIYKIDRKVVNIC
ncbi:MAG: DUF3990 domain-containing protein [Firmicutes bacterium]|nr:DUF3990 domain-containing protein [Bacillota bacterium]